MMTRAREQHVTCGFRGSLLGALAPSAWGLGARGADRLKTTEGTGVPTKAENTSHEGIRSRGCPTPN